VRQGPHPRPINNTTLPLLSRPDHCQATTHSAYVICLALALARLPVSTRCRRVRHAVSGGVTWQLAVTVTSLAGGRRGRVTGPLPDLPDLLVLLSFLC
jgi:hypothetical protein